MKRHSNRILAAAIASTAVVAMLTAPTAWAQEYTGPDSEACVEATAAYEAVPEPRGVPSDYEQKAQQTQTAVADGETRIAELQSVIDENQAFLDAPETAESAKPYYQGQVDTTKASLAEAETTQTALVAARDDAADALADDQDRFNDEMQAKKTAEAAMDEACAEPPTPGAPGEQGPPGEPGEPGEQGPQGEPGADGQDGADGVDGQDGADGRDGVDGRDGRDAPSLRNTPNGDANGVHYENCAAVRDAGAAPLYVGEPGFRDDLDANHNGIACEDPDNGGTLYNPVTAGEDPADYSQTGEVPVGSAETGQA